MPDFTTQHYIDAVVLSSAGRRGLFTTRHRNGVAGTLAGNPISDALANSIADPASQEALSDVFAKSAAKFVVTPEGQDVIRTISWQSSIPAFLLGFVAAWALARRGN